MNTGELRVSVLGRDSESTRLLVRYLKNVASIALAAVVIEEKEPAQQFFRRRAKRIGWLRTLGQLAFMALVQPLLRRTSRRRKAELLTALGGPPPPLTALFPGVLRVPSANTAAASAHLRKMAVDVVVLAGPRILGKKTLAAIQVPILNLHAGITPAYRGVHGAYWAFVQQDPSHAGITLHRVDAGIDTGEILAQATVTRNRQDNLTTYPLLQLQAGLPLLKAALHTLARGEKLPAYPQPELPSRLWYHPEIWTYLWHRIHRGIR